jgi:hypothetical protein
MRNRLEYCFVEATGSDETQYGLQDYGKEAKELIRKHIDV